MFWLFIALVMRWRYQFLVLAIQIGHFGHFGQIGKIGHCGKLDHFGNSNSNNTVSKLYSICSQNDGKSVKNRVKGSPIHI